ncbi:ATP synthase F1 subunit gamma [Haloimpatiens lingqiaonensis]|uniref:ATP synthase F1 subunit gamma n=1 Tax=Haloimpatiens lingqiaonensis TaxID=1380675 RepID=UPI0010FE3EC6|nr:ATP synthase F1 subunit gamma [Haloimpatiens lingqiaonensis]
MAGAGLIAIKRRIKSITNTRKITRAMNVVATSKLKKSRDRLGSNDKYYEYLEEIMSKVVFADEKSNIYKNGNSSEKKLYIMLTSDSGLCGGFNGEVVNHTIGLIKGRRDKSLVIVVGQKGRNYLKRFNIETVAEYVEIPDIPTSQEANILVKQALDMYEKGEVGEVNIVYHEFISTVKRSIKVKKLLPLENKSQKEEEKSDVQSYFEFEPSAGEILQERLGGYITGTVLNCMISSKCSEQASRVEAMSNATRNANDLLEKLNIKYNRIRQSAITQEISEIVGGAEAQK